MPSKPKHFYPLNTPQTLFLSMDWAFNETIKGMRQIHSDMNKLDIRLILAAKHLSSKYDVFTKDQLYQTIKEYNVPLTCKTYLYQRVNDLARRKFFNPLGQSKLFVSRKYELTFKSIHMIRLLSEKLNKSISGN